jgi:sensor histidine kinase regulating citrate/malate metabolism
MVNVGKGTDMVPDRGWSLYIVSVVMVIVSGLFVMVRLAIRLSRRMMGMDDYMIILVCPQNMYYAHT